MGSGASPPDLLPGESTPELRTRKMATAYASEERRITFTCAKCGQITDAFEGTDRHTALHCRDCTKKREDRRPRELNDLTGKEWAARSKSVEVYPDKRSAKQKHHGASFPQSLAATHIEMYTRRGGTVLDPFVGVGTTVDAAVQLGRKGIGIDINQGFLELARNSLAPSNGDWSLICDDAQRMSAIIEPESVDLLFTSPPYAHLLRNVKGAFAYKWKEHSKLGSVVNPRPYSTDAADLGNLSYADFLEATVRVMEQSRLVLRKGGYAAWVVKDFRDLKNGMPFVNFHGDIIECGRMAGLQLWDLRIVDQTKFRPLVCLGFPSDNFYLNIGHSYVVVFRNAG